MRPTRMSQPSGGPPPLSRPSSPPPLSAGHDRDNTVRPIYEPTASTSPLPAEGRTAPQWLAFLAAAGVALALAVCLILYVGVQSSSLTQGFSLAELVKAAEPSVVRITTLTDSGEGVGTGFLVKNDGTVVTNWHVIENASEATATLADGRTFGIRGCLGADPHTDLALLQIDCPAHLLPRPLKVSPTLPDKGEKVFALGNPMGLSDSVSDGIVAAVRSGTELHPDLRATVIQHTAPISQGNSGGPLINSRGEVVGVNTLASGPGVQNLNFAISSRDLFNMAANKYSIPGTLPSRARVHD